MTAYFCSDHQKNYKNWDKSWYFTKRFLFWPNIPSARAPGSSKVWEVWFNVHCLRKQNRECFSLKDYFNNWVITCLLISAEENKKNESNKVVQIILLELELLDTDIKFKINRKLNMYLLVRLFSNTIKLLYHVMNKIVLLVGVSTETLSFMVWLTHYSM